MLSSLAGSNAETLRPVFSPSNIGNATATLTTTQVLRGLMSSNPAAAATFTLPTAADLVAADKKAQAGTGIQFSICNLNGVNAITVAVGVGGTLSGSATVALTSSSMWYLLYTNVTASEEAYQLYRLS